VQLCLAAHADLAAEGIASRVVSMPSWELFEQQDQDYRDAVLPPEITARVAVEQASTIGWDHYVGMRGAKIGMRTFGSSAPLKDLLTKFGFTAPAVLAAAREQIARSKEKSV
jgi:transketolase